MTMGGLNPNEQAMLLGLGAVACFGLFVIESEDSPLLRCAVFDSHSLDRPGDGSVRVARRLARLPGWSGEFFVSTSIESRRNLRQQVLPGSCLRRDDRGGRGDGLLIGNLRTPLGTDDGIGGYGPPMGHLRDFMGDVPGEADLSIGRRRSLL